ncbi:MAG TPA: superoxide dismutase family protein [Candidatus Omnitrophota bacterium]|nr:superoxide dismutase family protein [Candidatus Omnitrophota bacterium]
MKRITIFFIIMTSILIATVATFVCAQITEPDAIATIKGTGPESTSIAGTVTFKQVGNDLTISVSVQGVPPGKHGFHIHEKGDCSDNGKAAGGHFNPMGVTHGFLPTDGHEKAHSGDMGNIDIAEDGTGKLELTLPYVHLSTVSGLAVILHEKVDDFGQPTGNAGGRIGCGIITPTHDMPEIMKTKAEPMKNDTMMMGQAEMGSMHEQMNATK